MIDRDILEKARISVEKNTMDEDRGNSISRTADNSLEIVAELHNQLNGMEIFLFGTEPKEIGRPDIKCLSDVITKTNMMLAIALERIEKIRDRLAG